MTLFTGVSVPKSKNLFQPDRAYELFMLQSHEQLEGWDIPVVNSKGVVLLFHGYISSKSQMLDYSNAFNEKGYSTMLIDFMGHGGSGGLETTVGYKEGQDVKVAFEYAQKKYPNQQIILLGSSLGAVAIMKAIEQYDIKPDKIILQCPFGSLLETTKARFSVMGLPATPLAQWLVLFGGWQTGFDAFAHNPIAYAQKINIPTAVLSGAKDKRVSKAEIDEIYKNLKGKKTIKFFKNSAHESYFTNDAAEWHAVVGSFLNECVLFDY